MRLLVALLFFVCLTAQAQRPTNAQLVEQIRERARQQQAIIDEMQGKLALSSGTVASLQNELTTAQTQIDQVAKERESWMLYGQDQHDRWMNAEKRVSDMKVKALRLWIALSLLVTINLAYAFLKFYVRLPI